MYAAVQVPLLLWTNVSSSAGRRLAYAVPYSYEVARPAVIIITAHERRDGMDL